MFSHDGPEAQKSRYWHWAAQIQAVASGPACARQQMIYDQIRGPGKFCEVRGQEREGSMVWRDLGRLFGGVVEKIESLGD